MLIHSPPLSVRVGKHFLRKIQLSRFLYVFHHRCHQPQRIVSTGILRPVDTVFFRYRDHCGGLEAVFFFLALYKPRRVKQMQAIPLGDQAVHQLPDALFALLRVGVRDRHGVLGRIPVP